jgi:hypothetical protein
LNTQDQEEQKEIRAAFFIDGFNLYHAIDDLEQPHLKWISYSSLAKILLPKRTQVLVGVTWCTAYYPGDSKKKWRHVQLVGAQKCHGVDVVEGHFVHEDRECRACDSEWRQPTEKQGDINVALRLIRDAYHDTYDHAYLISADSDQVATVRMFKDLFPEKKITAVVPPGRKRSEHISKLVNGGTIQINTNHLEKAVMPAIVFEPKVANTRRPEDYKPPQDWVHPDQRPLK